MGTQTMLEMDVAFSSVEDGPNDRTSVRLHMDGANIGVETAYGKTVIAIEDFKQIQRAVERYAAARRAAEGAP